MAMVAIATGLRFVTFAYVLLQVVCVASLRRIHSTFIAHQQPEKLKHVNRQATISRPSK